MNIKQKITAAAAIGGLALSVLAPASSFAATNTVKIKNNSPFSKNGALMNNKKTNVVLQGNATIAETKVGTVSNTGGNIVSFNNGKNGKNSIKTGDSITDVTVSVEGSTNTNNGTSCGCGDTSTDLAIQGNGVFSKNLVFVSNESTDVVAQGNLTVASTTVVTLSNTGLNVASFNTGGDSSIETGDSETTVEVTVEGGTNTN